MPSKTSTSHKKEWFSKAMFMQTYSNFVPIPIVYFIIVFMVLPMHIFMAELDADTIANMSEQLMKFPSYATSMGLPVAFLSGCMSAMLSFRYQHNNRSSNMVHSLPISRQTLFNTQYLAGLSFVLIPNVLILLLTMLAYAYHGVFYFTPLVLFFLMHCALYFFFYSFGVLCSNMTGSVGAVPMYFLAFNFIVLFATSLLEPLFELYYLGYSESLFDNALVRYLTPAMGFAFHAPVRGDYAFPLHITTLQESKEYILQPEDIHYYMEDPTVFGIYMVLGVVFVFVAKWLYKIRHIESAGEAVSVPWLKPVFRFLISVLGGLSLGVMTVLIISSSAGLTDEEMEAIMPFVSVVWALVFGLVAEMILQKSFRVLKTWTKSLVPVAVVAGIYGVLIFDLTGYESFIPAYTDLADVQYDYTNTSAYPMDSGNPSRLPTEEGKISQHQYELVTEIHRLALESNRAIAKLGYGGAEEGQVENWSAMFYTYPDGERMIRSYHYLVDLEEVDSQGTLAYALDQFYNDPELLRYGYDFDRLHNSTITDLRFVNLYSEEAGHFGTDSTKLLLPDYSSRQLEDLNRDILVALEQDFKEGNIGQKYLDLKDPEYIHDGLFALIEIDYQAENEDYRGKNGEVVGTDGIVLRPNFNSTGEKAFALTVNAVHTLTVLEDHGLLDNHRLLTNYERLELQKEWYQSPNSVHNGNAMANNYGEDFDPEDAYTYVEILRYPAWYFNN